MSWVEKNSNGEYEYNGRCFKYEQDAWRAYEYDQALARQNKKKQSGGFLSTILGLGIIGGGIWVGTNFGLAGLIVAGIIVFVGIPILIGFLMHK